MISLIYVPGWLKLAFLFECFRYPRMFFDTLIVRSGRKGEGFLAGNFQSETDQQNIC